MTDSTQAQTQGGQTAAEGNTATTTQQQPAPRSDAEADLQQGANQPQADADKAAADKAAAEKAQQESERKKNRTKAYIDRINAENAELRRKAAEYEARQPKPVAPKEPTLQDHGYDQEAYEKASREYALQQARTQWENEQKTQAEAQKQQQAVNAYQERASAFAAVHDDYLEVVGSIDPVLLPPELQAAIMGHEKGPEIAYQLAQNEDELFNLAQTRPELMERALARFASRMSDAQSDAGATAQQANALAAPAIAAQSTKPISQAPAPAPRVGGRSPTETPPEKLTDDEWYEREVERRRKR